jgi:hypothetical protein
MSSILLLRPFLLAFGSGLLFVINSIVLQIYPEEISSSLSYYFYLSQLIAGIAGVIFYNGAKIEYNNDGHVVEVSFGIVLLFGLVGIFNPFIAMSLLLFLRFALSRTDYFLSFSLTYFLFSFFWVAIVLWLLYEGVYPEYMYFGISMIACSIIMTFYKANIWMPKWSLINKITKHSYSINLIRRLSLDGILIIIPFVFIYLAKNFLTQTELVLFFKSMSVLALVGVLSLSIESIILNKGSKNINGPFLNTLLVLISTSLAYLISHEYFHLNTDLTILIIFGIVAQLFFSITITKYRKEYCNVYQAILAKRYSFLLLVVGVLIYYMHLSSAFEYILLLAINTIVMIILTNVKEGVIS